MEEEKDQEERHTLKVRRKIQEGEKTAREGNGGIDGQIQREVRWQRDGYLKECEEVELGIKIVIDLIAQAEEKQD